MLNELWGKHLGCPKYKLGHVQVSTLLYIQGLGRGERGLISALYDSRPKNQVKFCADTEQEGTSCQSAAPQSLYQYLLGSQ